VDVPAIYCPFKDNQMIEIDISAKLGEFNLQVNFEVERGITALFGPSGSGKTSLIRIIAGLETPDTGLIQISGRTLFDKSSNINLPTHKRKVGYVLQEANLFPHLTIRQNLTYARWAGRQSRIININDVCKVLGIEKLLYRMPDKLSGGERQRVAIGRALLSDPSILLLDEPLSALDHSRKLEILPFLEQIRDQFDIPMIYISHSVDEITRLADYLVVLKNGKQTIFGPIETVLRDLDIRGSGDALEAGSLLNGVCTGFDNKVALAQIDIGEQILQLPIAAMKIGSQVRLRIKANDVALALSKPDGISIQNMLMSKITALRQTDPSHVTVDLKIGTQQIRSHITKKAAIDLALEEGKSCIALLKAVALEGRGDP
jgi:molybdate transport system ATP-binding protein